MKNTQRATYSIPIHDHTMSQSLEDIMNEAIQLKSGFKFQLESVSFNVITYEEEKKQCYCGATSIQCCTFTNTPANCYYSKE